MSEEAGKKKKSDVKAITHPVQQLRTRCSGWRNRYDCAAPYLLTVGKGNSLLQKPLTATVVLYAGTVLRLVQAMQILL